MRLTLLVVFLLSPAIAFATKPCPSTPCFDAAGVFTQDKCFSAAQLIAVGSITDVTRHLEKHPLNRDFAKFSFNVLKVEKGATSTERMRFEAGWCDPELPKDLNSNFRIYVLEGSNPKKILAIEKLD